MRVALIQPYVPDLNTTPALGLLYLASVLERDGFETLVFDERLDSRTLDKILAWKPEIAGISAVTAAFPRGTKIAAELKKVFPGVTIVFGGPHPSAVPKDVAGEKDIDYVIEGEAEISFPRLCGRIRDNNADRTIKNIVRSPFMSGEELDDLPFPAFHLMDINTYFRKGQTHGVYKKGRRAVPIMTTRGCPFTCAFCCRAMGNIIRKRSVANVASEIDELVRRYNIDELYVEDDNFTVDRKRAFELLGVIKNSGVRYLKFANGVNINTVDEEMLLRMREANVYSVSFGIESGCPDTLGKMNKHISLRRARKIISFAKSIGLLVGANCIIGYPGETEDDVNKSLEYFFSLRLDSTAIVNLVPFPGTKARKLCEENRWLTKEAADWGNYYFSINNPIPLIETPYLSKTQLAGLIRKAYRKMYLNLSWLIKAAGKISLKNACVGIKLCLGHGRMRNT